MAFRRSRHPDEEKVKAILGRILSSYSGTQKSFWDYYNEMAIGVDASRETEWGELAEMILLFSGLFAAILTAFLIFTMTKLQPDNTDISKDILLRISLQLSNSSVPAYVEPEFSVPSHWAVVNALLFASLALVLVDAYLAVLMRGWLRDFDRSWKSSHVPEERARKREMRLQGLKRWKLHWVVALLPILIQASLVLYFISLVLMLINLYRPIAYPTLIILAGSFCCYLSTMVVSTFDPNAPFTSLDSKVLQVLIRWSRLRQGFTIILSRLKWRPWMTTHDAKVELGGSVIQLAISKRLRAATSNAVENLPVFMEIFDQWAYTPSLHPRKPSDWHQVLPLIQPYLSNESLCEDSILRSVARLFLCFNSKEFHTGRRAVIKALKKHHASKHSIERLYLHLLHQPESDWSSAYQMVPYLEADKHAIVELRWILDWVVSRLPMKSQESPNERDSPCISMQGVTFLCSTAVYIIQNRIMDDDDHGLFDSLLLITKSFSERSQKVDAFLPNMGLQTNSDGIDGEMLVSTRNSRISRESRWRIISDLQVMSCTSAAGSEHNFRLLIMLLMISMNSAVEYLDVYDRITYDLFTNPAKDLPILMDILLETWKSCDAERHLLIGIAARLLQPGGRFIHKSPPDAQQSTQDLFDAYDFYTSESLLLMTPNGLDFLEAILTSSLDGDSRWEPQTVQLRNPWLVMHIHNILRRGWCVPVGSAMREAVWGRLDSLGRADWLDKWLKWLDRLHRLLYRLKSLSQSHYIATYYPAFNTRLHRLVPSLNRIDWKLEQLKSLKWLDQLSPLDPLFEQLGWLDRFNPLLDNLNHLQPYLNQLEWLDMIEYDQVDKWVKEDVHNRCQQLDKQLDEQLDDRLDQQLDRLDQQLNQLLDQQLEQLHLEQQLHQFEQQRSAVLGMIAKSRLNLCNTEISPYPDLVPLALFLSPRNTDVCSDSRSRILKLFRSIPIILPPSPPDIAEPEVVDARVLFSDFFDSKAIGDLTKWRMLSLVVFPEWETISTEWKDLLAVEVLKVHREGDQRVDWMARVTPLLAGEFNLSEFMVAASSNSDSTFNFNSNFDSTYGSLTSMHLRMVAVIVEHLGAETLTDQTLCELEKFLEQHSNLLCDGEELDRIWTVIDQARARYSQSGIPLALVESDIIVSDIIVAGPSHSPE